MTQTAPAIRSYTDITGWFFGPDRTLFDALLDSQPGPGDLVELGAYLGRSAVVIGDHLRAGERFVVVDLFGAESEDTANRSENTKSYPTLTRTEFEHNYLSLHDELPVVVQGLSTEVVEHVAPGSARFVHVDASHLYAQVAADIEAVRAILQPDGVVVFDDIRAEHTPGVTAAVWEAASRGMVPFALTQWKLYATWGDSAGHLDTVRNVVAADERLTSTEQQIMGHQVVRLKELAAPKAPARPAAPAVVSLSDTDIDRVARRVVALQPKPQTVLTQARRALRRRLG